MLEYPQVVYALEEKFAHNSIVFWNDSEREFWESVDSIAGTLSGVTLIRLDEEPALGVKIHLEQAKRQSRYLLYAPFEAPAPEVDWLLDVRLYSATFRADRASIQLAGLGLGQIQSLRDHVRKRAKFFASKDRVARLARLIDGQEDTAELDSKMLAVVTRSDQAELFSLLAALFHDMGSQDGGLDALPSAWDDIIKFGLAAPFWTLVGQAFGYEDAEPRLRTLLLRLLVSDFAHSVAAPLPAALQHHVLPKAFHANIAVFLNQWRDSATRGSSYDRISALVGDALHLADHLTGLAAEALINSDTFLVTEKRIASELRDRVVEEADVLEASMIKALASSRQDRHWASDSLHSTPDVPRRAFHAIYDALSAAADLLELVRTHRLGFSYDSPKAMYCAYEADLFRFDQLYRHFNEHADVAHTEGWDLLKPLRDQVEASYGNGYVIPISLAWGNFVEKDLLPNWQIEGTESQYQFYARKVKPVLDRGDVRRVFVVISDAFRYEAAQELTADLNGRFRFRAELTSLLGVLPSYTALGMASLLPHASMTYGTKGEVLADGRSTVGLENRDKILETVGGVAVMADTLTGMKKEDGRAFIRDHRVVYVYHNVVDAVGDSASTEDDTFGGVRRAINELANLVRHIINSLNGSYVIVTADHGFLFQHTAPTVTEKSVLGGDKPAGTVIAKKRYILGRDLPSDDRVYRGTTEATAGADGDMEFWLPKGINRFHFTGGARYVHGGAMLQEVVVPVVTVRELEGGAAEGTQTRPVQVHILGNNLKATTNRYRVQLIQTEATSERIKPITLQVAIYDGETPISNVETITFDSASADMEGRMKSILLALKAQNYDRKKIYHLVLRNAEDGIEQQRADITIDLAFGNEF
jgi:uncharacterized protein (TIGR02687 family)